MANCSRVAFCALFSVNLFSISQLTERQLKVAQIRGVRKIAVDWWLMQRHLGLPIGPKIYLSTSSVDLGRCLDAGGSALPARETLTIHGLIAGKLKYLAHEWLSFEPRTVEREAIRRKAYTYICMYLIFMAG